MSKNFVDYNNATDLMNGVEDRIEKNYFEGTKEEWDALTDEQKAAYDQRAVHLKNGDNNPIDLSGYQKKNLDTPVTVGGVQQTQVEGAIGALNDLVPDGTSANDLLVKFSQLAANAPIRYQNGQSVNIEDSLDAKDISKFFAYLFSGSTTGELVSASGNRIWNILNIPGNSNTAGTIQLAFAIGSNRVWYRTMIWWDSSTTYAWSKWFPISNEYYSTAGEVRTNKTWTDGKPIYRKVYSLTSPSTANLHVDLAALPANTETVVNMYGFVLRQQYKLPLNIFVNENDYVIGATSNTHIRMAVGSVNTGCSAYITVEYTKSTD